MRRTIEEQISTVTVTPNSIRLNGQSCTDDPSSLAVTHPSANRIQRSRNLYELVTWFELVSFVDIF